MNEPPSLLASTNAVNGQSSCAEISLAQNEPMLGTATEVDVWIMLEYREEWRSHATEDNDLPISTARWLAATTENIAQKGLNVRLQFIKTRNRRTDPLSIFIARDDSLFQLKFEGFEELAQLNLLQDINTTVTDPHYFVCTNGQRDTCCSRLGLSTWRKLYSKCGERVWQTTHLGGHRFAPNILVLPTCHMYGRVFTDEIDVFFDQVEQGAIPIQFLRGKSLFSPAAQTCEHLVSVPITREVRSDSRQVKFSTVAGEAVFPQPAMVDYEVLASCKDTERKCITAFIQTE